MWPCLTGTVLEKQGCPLAVEGWLLSSGAGVLGLRIRRSPGLAQQEPVRAVLQHHLSPLSRGRANFVPATSSWVGGDTAGPWTPL